MKIDALPGKSIAGMCWVEIHFNGDDGVKDVRPPMSVLVEAEGGYDLVCRAAYSKLHDELPESETEVRELLAQAIHEPGGTDSPDARLYGALEKDEFERTEERGTPLENAFVTLSEMVRQTDQRADQHQDWINLLGSRTGELVEAQANTERQTAALVDAQIRTEDALTHLVTRMSELADAQARTDAQLAATDRRLNDLIEVVRGQRDA